MLESRITKTWAGSSSKWMYQRHVAYIDNEYNLETVLLLGWSAEEVKQKTGSLFKALLDEVKD